MISLRSVRKLYPPEQVALQHVDLQVESGEFLFVAGASGAGKSTLLKLLFAAEQPTQGSVEVAGRSLSKLSSEDVASLRRDIGIVFQDYKLLPGRNIQDNVAFSLEVRGVPFEERREMARMALATLNLESKIDAFPEMLSGGEQQRVAVARALIHRPKLVIADEPTGNLDPDMSRVVFDLLLEANAAGVTVLVASHNLALIEELNLRTLVLDAGRIIGDFDRPRG